MISLPQVRTDLAAIIEDGLGDQCTVYRGALDATANLPLIALGVPEFRPDVQPCADQITLPVATVVQLASGASGATQDALETLWGELVDLLRQELRSAPNLGVAGLRNVVISRASFGGFNIQGKEYPALVTYLDLYGKGI